MTDVTPHTSYARMYAEIMEFVRENGQFDAATMGNVSNVGLMAKKAEEYGSHDKTFEQTAKGESECIQVSKRRCEVKQCLRNV